MQCFCFWQAFSPNFLFCSTESKGGTNVLWGSLWVHAPRISRAENADDISQHGFTDTLVGPAMTPQGDNGIMSTGFSTPPWQRGGMPLSNQTWRTPILRRIHAGPTAYRVSWQPCLDSSQTLRVMWETLQRESWPAYHALPGGPWLAPSVTAWGLLPPWGLEGL